MTIVPKLLFVYVFILAKVVLITFIYSLLVSFQSGLYCSTMGDGKIEFNLIFLLIRVRVVRRSRRDDGHLSQQQQQQQVCKLLRILTYTYLYTYWWRNNDVSNPLLRERGTWAVWLKFVAMNLWDGKSIVTMDPPLPL